MLTASLVMELAMMTLAPQQPPPPGNAPAWHYHSLVNSDGGSDSDSGSGEQEETLGTTGTGSPL